MRLSPPPENEAIHSEMAFGKIFNRFTQSDSSAHSNDTLINGSIKTDDVPFANAKLKAWDKINYLAYKLDFRCKFM